MKRAFFILSLLLIFPGLGGVRLCAQPSPPAVATVEPPQMIAVDSPAWVFSPGNWVGDAGRMGSDYRQTWYPGAYCRVTWQSTSAKPGATILFDTSTYPPKFPPPLVAFNVDGVWQAPVPCAPEVSIPTIKSNGKHCLTLYVCSSQQNERWGSAGKSGLNVVRVKGVKVDAGSTPVPDKPAAKWALIVGDSITEGIKGSPLACYSYLVGQSLRSLGYEYGLDACGWSGWLQKGDNPPGDVPAYYFISGSQNGVGGQYDDSASRWNKIDANHSLLDSAGHLSAYGGTGQEPSLILINYGTNDTLRKSNPGDVVASMNQGLEALSASAPGAQIVVIIPFGQFKAAELKQAVAHLQAHHPGNVKISIIDLEPEMAHNLSSPSKFMGGLHPNDRGYALIAALIMTKLAGILDSHQG